MTQMNEAALAHELMRGMRPDAHRYVRPDWRRHWRAGHESDPFYRLYESVERKYRPDQPRVPAGDPAGGQWTGGARADASRRRNDGRTQYAQVIRICIASGRSLNTNLITGQKTYSVTYDCAGGKSITRSGSGHSFHGIILDPF